MNTKNKIIAILMAGIVAMAIGVPAMVNAKDVDVGATIGNADPVVEWKWEYQDPSHDEVSPEIEIMPGQDMYKCVLVSDGNGNEDIDEIIWHFNDTGFDEIPATADDVIKHTETLSGLDLTLVPKPADPAIPTAPCWVELKAQNPTLYDAATIGAQKDCYCMYTGTWAIPVSADLPAGTNYHVQVMAIDKQDAESAWLINDVELLEVIQLDVDVAAVDLGVVQNFVHKWVNGDAVWGVPDATIHNTGNIPIDVEVGTAGLTCTTPATCDAKVIAPDDLDADVDKVGAQWLGPGGPKCFITNLNPCDNTELDFSICVGCNTGVPAPPGTYSGTATIAAVKTC